MKKIIIFLILLISFPSFAAQTNYRHIEPETITAIAANLTALNGQQFSVNQAYVAIKYRSPVATYNIAAGDALLDTTAAPFAGPMAADHTTPVDLAAFQTGKYIAAFYNTTGGYALLARISATAPGALEEATDVLAGWNLTSGWATTNTTINDANTFTLSSANGYVSKSSPPFVAGSLYKVSFDTSQTAGSPTLAQSSTAVVAVDGTANKYFTAVSTGCRVTGTTNGSVVDINTMAAYRVTSPGATGILLESSPTVAGVILKDANFNPNAAMRLDILYAGD